MEETKEKKSKKVDRSGPSLKKKSPSELLPVATVARATATSDALKFLTKQGKVVFYTF